MNQIFVALSTFAERDSAPLDLLRGSGISYKLHQTGKRITTQELLRDGTEAAVIIAGVEPYDRAVLEALPNLRCICRCGVGVDSIDLAAARERGITVLNTPDAPAVSVAELTVTMMLALSRNLPRQIRSSGEKEWVRYEAHLLGARRVGLVGLGKIGRRVATLLLAFGAQVRAFDPFASGGDGVVLSDSLDELLEWSDIVSLHASRTAAHPLRLGRRELTLMRPGSIIVNVARGDMLDEAALLEALETGHLAGAGLDVFPEEPYKGRLCELPNVVLTPHVGTLTVETRAQMETECVDKSLRFLRGELRSGEGVI